MKRHLAFSLYPRALPDHGWRRSVRELMRGRRWQQFDGLRVVSIALDECTVEPWEVIREFGHDANLETEFIEHENVPALQEVAGFVPMLERIEIVADPEDIIYRLHSKSCTHREGSASAMWMRAAMSALTDYPALIDCALQRAHVCGPFRCRMPFLSSGFHFQGSFYAMRAGELFKRDWRRVDQHFAGTESYPGVQFQHSESACLFYDNSDTASLYQPEFHLSNVTPALAYWRASLAKCGLTPLSDGGAPVRRLERQTVAGG